VHWADTVGCVTEGDRRVLEAMTAATNLVTLPLGTEVEAFAPVGPGHTTHPPRLLFVGSFAHPPNAEGAERFLTEVLPRIRARHPEVVTEIVGANPPEALRRRADGRVELPGFVDDLDAVFRRAHVFVAPLYSGGGIKIKVLEAMGRGAAIVTTPIGAEGIDPDGAACRVAEDSAAFAGAVSDLLDDPGARSDLGRRARAHVEAHYSWPAIVQRLEERVQSSQARQGGTGRSSP
jgi:glycosyltransferase involved in cell wall biosynthesis